MKSFALLFVVCASQVAAHSRIHALIQKVLSQHAIQTSSKSSDSESENLVAGVFDVAGFDEEETTGKIGIKLRIKNPVKLHLTKEQQQPTWNLITDPNSPMESGKWRTAANGFRFQNAVGQQLHCEARQGKLVADSLLLDFGCRAHKDQGQDEPRFARVSSTFWEPSPDGHVPYGFPNQWGDFDYPYYAVSDQGYLGCAAVNQDGYCFEISSGSAINSNFGYNDSPSNKPVSLFPYDSFQPADLLPGSKFSAPTPGPAVTGEAPHSDEHKTATPPSQQNEHKTATHTSEQAHAEEHTTPLSAESPQSQTTPSARTQQEDANYDAAPQQAQVLSTSAPPFTIAKRAPERGDTDPDPETDTSLKANKLKFGRVTARGPADPEPGGDDGAKQKARDDGDDGNLKGTGKDESSTSNQKAGPKTVVFDDGDDGNLKGTKTTTSLSQKAAPKTVVFDDGDDGDLKGTKTAGSTTLSQKVPPKTVVFDDGDDGDLKGTKTTSTSTLSQKTAPKTVVFDDGDDGNLKGTRIDTLSQKAPKTVVFDDGDDGDLKGTKPTSTLNQKAAPRVSDDGDDGDLKGTRKPDLSSFSQKLGSKGFDDDEDEVKPEKPSRPKLDTRPKKPSSPKFMERYEEDDDDEDGVKPKPREPAKLQSNPMETRPSRPPPKPKLQFDSPILESSPDLPNLETRPPRPPPKKFDSATLESSPDSPSLETRPSRPPPKPKLDSPTLETKPKKPEPPKFMEGYEDDDDEDGVKPKPREPAKLQSSPDSPNLETRPSRPPPKPKLQSFDSPTLETRPKKPEPPKFMEGYEDDDDEDGVKPKPREPAKLQSKPENPGAAKFKEKFFGKNKWDDGEDDDADDDLKGTRKPELLPKFAEKKFGRRAADYYDDDDADDDLKGTRKPDLKEASKNRF